MIIHNHSYIGKANTQTILFPSFTFILPISHGQFYFLNKNKNPTQMLPPTRTRSVEFPRSKIYLSHLNQLMDKKVVVQPEI